MPTRSRRLLLVSTSTTHGTGYLDHCAEQIQALLGDLRQVLFVPYALRDHDGYTAKARERYGRMGNTFRLLARLYEKGLLDPIRERVAAGMPYVGTSAGSNVACVTIRTTNDMPIVEPPSFEALNLVPFNINPHYLDPVPGSTHMGETREERLLQFLEENDKIVVGLREGAMLRIEDASARLLGTVGARIFRRGHDPQEFRPGDSLDFILAG
jgi:dipeptidase E